MNSTDLKDKLSNTAEKAKETAVSAMNVVTEAGRTVKDEVKTHAADTLETVRDAASERAGAARDSIVSAGERLAETLHDHADAAKGIPSRVLNGLAGGVSSATEGLRDRTLGDMITGAKDYARRNPGTFAVGAAVAGFALARFLRSSGNRLTAEQRAAETTDRIYRDAARRTVDGIGNRRDGGNQA